LSWDAQNRDYVLEHFRSEFYQEAAEGEKFWFDDFLRGFGKSHFKRSSDWLESDSKFDLESDLYMKRSRKETYDESLKFLALKGLRVYQLSSEDLEAVLLKVKERPQDWIMALTIFELKLLTQTKVEGLSSALGWHRKRFFYQGKKLESLPNWSSWLGSPFKPWKDGNLNILIKSSNEESFVDVWSLEHVYREDAKESSCQRTLSFLKDRFPYVEFVLEQNNNLEGHLKTVFPVSYEKAVQNDSGYIWNSPIEWKGYAMDLMYEHQNKLAHKIYDKGVGQ